jgi:Oxaloacetate decarboxylase, gamma chain.
MNLLLSQTDQTMGWIVTIVGFCIVIISLWILSCIFRGFAALINRKPKEKVQKEETIAMPQKATVKGEIPAEVITAIGMALFLSTEVHDEESNVITIKKRNTPWNSKEYGVRHWNR